MVRGTSGKLRPVSRKMAAQKRQERELIQVLLVRRQGRCERCGMLPDWRGLSKHEKVHRSQGGDPLAPNNVQLICSKCHSERHGVRER